MRAVPGTERRAGRARGSTRHFRPSVKHFAREPESDEVDRPLGQVSLFEALVEFYVQPVYGTNPSVAVGRSGQTSQSGFDLIIRVMELVVFVHADPIDGTEGKVISEETDKTASTSVPAGAGGCPITRSATVGGQLLPRIAISRSLT